MLGIIYSVDIIRFKKEVVIKGILLVKDNKRRFGAGFLVRLKS